MKTKLLYFDDPLCLEFSAEVSEIVLTEAGKYSAFLPQTYFYPTSGGQDHDTGKIGEAIVLDVYKGEDGSIIHVLDREISPGTYPAKIDRMHRWQNMQAHTAQHILSRTFELELNLETLSANINADSPSTIDLEPTGSFPDDFSFIEQKANSIIFEDRTVKSYYITDDEVSSIPFRKPPKVTGEIRVVEVDGYDYSACGGTHCPQTGMVGLIKILRSEIQNRKIRVSFVAGYQALSLFQSTYATITRLASLMETGKDGLVVAVQKQIDNLHTLRSELETLQADNLVTLADQLLASANEVGRIKLVSRFFQAKSVGELRKLVVRICSIDKVVVTLAAIEGKKVSLIVGCSTGLPLDASEILKFILDEFGGNGGGDQHLAQGGCLLPDQGIEGVFEIAKNYLLNHTVHSQ